MNRSRKYINFNLVVAGILLMAATAVQGATFTVTKTADTNDGVCNADCSLREAVEQVNNFPPGSVVHQIVFSPLFDTLQTIALTTPIGINRGRMEIIGSGNQNLTLTAAAGNTFGVLSIGMEFARIHNIRFADSDTSTHIFQGGAAISASDGGDLIIERCLFENNRAPTGGAVDVQANTSVTIKDSTFRNNEAVTGGGGAVFLESYTNQTISGSTFSGNRAANGAAVYFSAYLGLLTHSKITNSTFSDNTSSGGSIIYNTEGLLDLVNVTVANNSGMTGAVDSVTNAYTQTNITNSIVSLNSGGNLGANVNQIAPNFVGGNPLLSPLALNGGETETRALVNGSPAIDTGTSTGAPPTDQRGVARPQGAGFDLGAFEKEFLSLPLQIVTDPNLPSGMVNQTYSQQIVAADGAPPYTFAPTGGTLPNGITLSPSGSLSGPPTQYGIFSFTVTVTDSASATAQKTFQLVIQPLPLQIVTDPNLPSGMVNQTYSQQIVAADGAPPYSFAVTGGALPNGITLSPSGLLRGPPTQYGTFSFTVTVTDSASATAQRTFQLVIQPLPLQIATNSNLPSGMVNQTYSEQIVAADGAPPYSFAVTAGALPNGITLSGGGLLDGIPTQFGMFSFEVTVTDSLSATALRTFQLTIQPLPLEIPTNPNLPAGTVGVAYSQSIVAGGGVSPYSFLLESGTLPNGLTLSAAGLLDGTPTTAGASNFIVKVTDSAGTAVQKAFGLGVVYLPPRFVTDQLLPVGFENEPYSQQIYFTDGSTPYQFSFIGGALPTGLTLSTGGLLSGVPTQFGGQWSFSVRVRDGLGLTVDRMFILSVNRRRPVFIVTKTADTNDTVCNADCSLREAFNASASTGGVITFSAFFDTPRTIVLTSEIMVAKSIELRGKGAERLTIDGGGTTRLFTIGSDPFMYVTFRNLRMTNALGAIFSSGSRQLKIENCIFDNNSSPVGGGAINLQSGSLLVTHSTFRNNSATGSESGGALLINPSVLPSVAAFAAIANSTFVANRAEGGSAIYSKGLLLVTNSTFSGNFATAGTCACSSTILTDFSGATLTNVTIANNEVSGSSGAALRSRLARSRIFIKNSIIADNFSLSPVISPNLGNATFFQSLGGNLIGSAGNLNLPPGMPNGAGDYIGAVGSPLDPLLAPLSDNGGETETRALLAGSLAVNNGNPVGAVSTDQRGAARPQGTGVDIGAFETGVPVTSGNTPVGSNTNVTLGAVRVIFSGVSQAGTTTQIPIDPSAAGTLPGGFSFGSGLPAFQISTNANYTAPITICIAVPGVNDPAFNTLRLFHYESGVLVDRTVARDFLTRTICAQTTSLSPFAVAQELVPTAADVSISGRVLTANGSGLRNAIVVLTDQSGAIRTARTGSFGYYRFDDIEAGQSVILNVRSKLYQFAPQVVWVNDSIADLDFLAVGENIRRDF